MGLRVPALPSAVPRPSAEQTIHHPAFASPLPDLRRRPRLLSTSAHTATGHTQTLAAHPNRSRDGSGTARQNCQIGSEPASRPNRSTTATVGPAAPCPCGRHWRAARCCMLVCRAAGRRETDPHRGLQVEVEACCVQQDRDSGTAGCFLSCPMTHPISIAQIEI